tara:strand:+ start:90 stop:263 length:174 start_codon:yes stop_codon:yes gene_type:complete
MVVEGAVFVDTVVVVVNACFTGNTIVVEGDAVVEVSELLHAEATTSAATTAADFFTV